MKTEELKAMCEKCTHKNPCAVCLVDALIKDDQRNVVVIAEFENTTRIVDEVSE